MFSDWVQPDYKKLLENDLEHTKLKNLFKKNPEIYDKIVQVY
jgi:hypothetical protein